MPAEAVTALKHNFLTEDEAEGIVSSMCLMGSIQPGERESVKEKLIFLGEENAAPTMVACVEHVDDGEGLVGGI